MIWLAIALILAVPAWLGLTRAADSPPRRFIGRCVVLGLILGMLVSGGLWLASPHVPTGWNLLRGPVWGAAGGAAVGLIVGLPWMIRQRYRSAPE